MSSDEDRAIHNIEEITRLTNENEALKAELERQKVYADELHFQISTVIAEKSELLNQIDRLRNERDRAIEAADEMTNHQH